MNSGASNALAGGQGLSLKRQLLLWLLLPQLVLFLVGGALARGLSHQVFLLMYWVKIGRAHV